MEAEKHAKVTFEAAEGRVEVDLLAGPPCGVPFAVRGLGGVVVPAWPPNAAQFRAAFTSAFRDSERTAQALCALNPNCPFAAFVALLPRNPAQGTGYFRQRIGPVDVLVCRMICVWICIDMIGGNPAPEPWDDPGDIG
jgi:hypothetical protein